MSNLLLIALTTTIVGPPLTPLLRQSVGGGVQNILLEQGSVITKKLPYVIMYVWQNIGIRHIHDVHKQIPKSIYQASSFLPKDFPNIFS